MRAILMFQLEVMDKVTRQCPQTTTFEEKGEPKRYGTEVLPLTSLTPYRWAKPALVCPLKHLYGRVEISPVCRIVLLIRLLDNRK